MRPAPLFTDIAEGPPGGQAYWLIARDGLRLRIAHWPLSPAKGTVLLFAGRTEAVEKYGRTAGDLAARGYGLLTIDWRGQGLSDRLAKDAMIGHVSRFRDYQNDVVAMLHAAGALDLPRPWHLLAHSMGGAIGLRAAIEGAPVASCAFSAPMWGIHLTPLMRPLAWALAWTARRSGLGHLLAPGTTHESYILSEPFADNLLTRDAEIHAYMVAQLRAHPELSLGGPSLNWLFEALNECRHLQALPSPALPCLTFVGTEEAIVDTKCIEARIRRWPAAQLVRLNGARHEAMMDTPSTRTEVWDRLTAFWAGSEPA